MTDYKSAYFALAGKLSDVIDIVDYLSVDLKEIQRNIEDSIISEHEQESSKAGLKLLKSKICNN